MHEQPTKIKKPSLDCDRTLIKAHQKNKKCGKTIHLLGTQQKEPEPLLVPPREEDQHAAEFIHEMGLTREQAAGETDVSVSCCAFNGRRRSR